MNQVSVLVEHEYSIAQAIFVFSISHKGRRTKFMEIEF
jgi:hypothetical protein